MALDCLDDNDHCKPWRNNWLNRAPRDARSNSTHPQSPQDSSRNTQPGRPLKIVLLPTSPHNEVFGWQTLESEEGPTDFNAFITRYLNRPFVMFALEPILALMTLYMTFIYGFIYLLFEAWPISFIDERGYNAGVGALPFIGIGIGVALGSGFIAHITYTRIMNNFKKNGYITFVSSSSYLWLKD